MRARFAPVVFALIALAAFHAAAQTVLPPIAAGLEPRAVAVDPSLRKAYVANYSSNTVTILDTATNATATVAVGQRPSHVAVNPVTHKVYVSNVGDGTTSVIDPATNVVTPIMTGGSGPITIDATRDRIYNARTGKGDEVNVIRGDTNYTYAMAIESYGPVGVAVNPDTNKLYVANYISGQVSVVPLAVDTDYPHPKQVGVWTKPVALALDRPANKVYVIVDDARGPIGVIDGATDTAVSFAPAGHAQGPRAIAVNALTHKAYAAFTNEVVVIDGATNGLSFIPVATPVAIAVNESTNKVYAVSASGVLSVIDGATQAVTTVAIPSGATALDIDPLANRVYIVGPGITIVEAGGAASPPPAPAESVNAQGLWWASPPGSESGWGVNLTHQGDILFATWFTYDRDGTGMWLVMSNGARRGTNEYSGALYRTNGPAYNSATFDSSKVVHAAVGTASFSFSDANNGTFTAVVDGQTMTKSITRQLFASPAPACAPADGSFTTLNYQALWWRAPALSESGWGVNIAHQGNVLFVTWFTYDAGGKGLWLVGSNVAQTGPATFSGPLQKVSGPPFNAVPWNSNLVSRVTVGTVAFDFSDAVNGTMTYTLDGVTTSKPITRQVFSSPQTICR